MVIFLTGGTGFIGGAVARLLRERGDDVVALVRTPGRAEALSAIGATLVQGGLADVDVIRSAMAGADAVIHGAAVYEVGIRPSERPAMYETNVVGTENVLGAARDLGIPKVVYVSTVAAFGNTEGRVVEEGYVHRERYTSYYDETKHLAHRRAQRLIADGLPCVVVQPGAVYGPGDHSQLGNQLTQFLKGRLPLLAFGDLGLSLVHRDDVAQGVLLALDKGVPGEHYVLGGEVSTLRGFIDAAAKVSGRRPPRGPMPASVVKAAAALGPVVGPMLGYPPNMKELVSSSHKVTFWARSDKAKRELGWTPRPLEQGMRDTLLAIGAI
ncbi:MAG TPA: NAD-dependent epimerase/dehydratase family protein [Mycobacteriales bacterium]|nr:NAD-dependent epimerase/dehydratase family protein [Mycobacteriales bacterium]